MGSRLGELYEHSPYVVCDINCQCPNRCSEEGRERKPREAAFVCASAATTFPCSHHSMRAVDEGCRRNLPTRICPSPPTSTLQRTKACVCAPSRRAYSALNGSGNDAARCRARRLCVRRVWLDWTRRALREQSRALPERSGREEPSSGRTGPTPTAGAVRAPIDDASCDSACRVFATSSRGAVLCPRMANI